MNERITKNLTRDFLRENHFYDVDNGPIFIEMVRHISLVL